MLYTLVVIISMHWGTTPSSTNVVPHFDLSEDQCQVESANWITWSNELRTKMNNTGAVAVYASCLPEGSGHNWWN
jgi:hypothetical protein